MFYFSPRVYNCLFFLGASPSEKQTILNPLTKIKTDEVAVHEDNLYITYTLSNPVSLVRSLVRLSLPPCSYAKQGRVA